MSAVPAKPAPPGQRAHQKNKPRPIDFYRPLPFCRPKGKNDFKYVSITAAGRSLVTVSRQKLEAGLFEGVTTYDKAIRLNVPTPSYQDVEDYDQLVPEQGPLPRAFLRSKPPKRSTLPKVPGEKAEAALALGRPLGAAPPADMSGNPACAESDDEPEFVLGADDERWLRETLPDAVRKKLGAGARAEAQKGRSHKKGAGKAAQLEQQKAEEERRKREEAEKRAALAAQPATRGKKSKEEDLVQAMEVDEATQATEENVQRHVNALTGAHLEAVIDTLEVLTGPWPGIVAKGQQAADALKSNEPTWRGGVGSKLVLKEPQLAAVLGPVIHAYWLQKRQKLGKPLLRRFWPATSPTDSNPHCVFRPREKERYKLRKHRKNDVDAFRKLQQLRRDFETARDLCALARRRETVRRLRGDASRGRLRRALDTLAKQRGVEALPDTFPFADQDEDYRLTPNEVAAATKALADAEAAKKAQAQLPVGLGVPVVTAPAPAPAPAPVPAPAPATDQKRWSPEVVAQVLRERLASVALRPLEEPMVEDDYPEERGVVKRTVSVRDRDDAARRRRNKKQRRAFEEDTYALPPGTSNATARAQANTPKRPLHGQPGPACIPQKGFMDTGWLHRDDAALAVALDRVFLDPPVATEGPEVMALLKPPPDPLPESEFAPDDKATQKKEEKEVPMEVDTKPKPRDPNKPVDVADDAEAMKAVTAAAQAEFVRLTVSTVRRRARVGRGGRVLVDRYGSHTVPKAVPPPDSKPSSHVRPASPRPTAQRQASFTGRVRYASQARVSAPPLSTPKKARGTARAGWFSLTDDGYSSSSSDCDSVNEAPQIIPEAPPPPPPPEPEREKSQPCAACRGAHSAHTCGTRGASAEAAAAEAREAAEKIAAAAAASQAVDALAPADVGRTRGGTRKLQDEDEYGPPVEPPRPFWVGVADDSYRARMATLPARRPAATCPQQRLAEIYGLSDSEDEDLYPADQPDLHYTTPGAPRIKFAVDA